MPEARFHPTGIASPGVLAIVEPIGSPCLPGAEVDPSANRVPVRSGGTVEAGREDRGVPDKEGGGRISVLSTLVPFRLGFGAKHGQRRWMNDNGTRRTVLILGHVESSKQHDGFFPIVTSFSDERRMCIQ